MATKKADDRCWPGYEPVPGKPEQSQGSCRKKPESKTTSPERSFVAKREKQLDTWQKEHPKSPRKSAQHLHAPAATKSKKPKAAAKSKAK